MLKKKTLLLSLAVILVIVASVVLVRNKKQNGKIETVTKGEIVEAVYGIGTVTANQTFQLKVGVISTLRKLFVKEGDSVPKGKLLVSLEGSSTFSAPFSGVITNLPYKEGETIFPQTPVLTLINLNDRYMVVSLEQRGAIRVKKGQTAKISFDSLRDQVFEGKVSSVFSNDKQFIVHIEVSHIPLTLLPGMTSDVAIEIEKRKNVVLIPAGAISNSKVVRIRDGKKETIEVKVGTIDGEKAEVKGDDLKEGDQIFLKTKQD